MITIFKTWGVPQWIKVDNGRPFGDPRREMIPPLSLWLIALGIKVIWNAPRSPQQNAKVERTQGVMGKWTEYHKCEDTFDLQQQVWKEADFYNFFFPIRKLNNKKRIEVFPKLLSTGQKWKPYNFEIQRVLDFLADGGIWERKVSTNGQFTIFGSRFNVGAIYKHQRVSIKICPQNNQWQIFNALGKLIKSFPTGFSETNLWNLDFS